MFALLLDSAVPVVLHNGWLDLLFLYHSFYGPLPPNSVSIMADLLEMFSAGVYDTKAIAQFQFREDGTFLEYVFRIW
jgi:target of EGR1 protein 1